MDLLKHRFLWLPVLGFLALFAVDKLFLLPVVTDHTVHWQKVEPAFYESRRLLFEQLRQQYPERQAAGQRLGLILGSSRAGEFDQADIAKLIPNSYTYNFSAPFSSPVFYAYWVDQILAAGMEPAFVILETDPVVLTDKAMEFTLQYSLDPGYVWRHTDLNMLDIFGGKPADPWQAEGRGLTYDQAESYFAAYLFGLHRYPIKLSSILANNRDLDNMGFFVPFSSPIEYRDYIKKILVMANQQKLGGIPNPMLSQKGPGEMQADAEAKAAIFLQNVQISATQVIFTKNLLRRLAARNIPVVVYWPISTDEYHAKAREYNMGQQVQDPLRATIARIRQQYTGAHIQLYDPNEDPRMTCRAFYDSHHLSGACFPELTGLIIEQFPARLRQ